MYIENRIMKESKRQNRVTSESILCMHWIY